MFYVCYNFNQNISRWKVGKVRNMEYMFYCCKNFNQPLKDWEVKNVESKYNMFYNCNILEEYKPKFN